MPSACCTISWQSIYFDVCEKRFKHWFLERGKDGVRVLLVLAVDQFPRVVPGEHLVAAALFRNLESMS